MELPLSVGGIIPRRRPIYVPLESPFLHCLHQMEGFSSRGGYLKSGIVGACSTRFA